MSLQDKPDDGESQSKDNFQSKVKKNLSKELSRVIKKIQQHHISSDSAVRSGDSANAVCNIIEAIFLHGLRDSFSNKLSSYFSSASTARTSTPNFWQFLVSFTHKDVVKQLNHLAHITTEIGQCRAWIRLALNDGLMESYIAAMLLDTGKLKTFYHSYSYLRDQEQPYIMKNYVQGLSDFVFQLSYNSSVLNMWGTSPLKLVGLGVTESDSASASATTSPVSAEPPPTSPVEIEFRKATKKPKVKSRPLGRHDSGSGLDELVSPSSEYSYRESEMSSSLLATPPDDYLLSKRGSRNQGQIVSHLAEGSVSLKQESNPQVTESTSTSKVHTFEKGKSEFVAGMMAQKELNSELGYSSEKQSGGKRSKVEGQRSDNAQKTNESNAACEKPEESSPKMEAMPEVSEVVAEVKVVANVQEAADTSQGYVESTNSMEGEEIETGIAAGEDEDLGSYVGNSLSARSGWSSEFEKLRTPEGETVSPIREKSESFGSLLQSYVPRNKQAPSPVMADLLTQLPYRDKGPIKDQPGCDKTEDSELLKETDFEVVPLAHCLTAMSADPRSHALLTLLTEITTEKGLDSQNYQCKGCSRPIGIIYGKAKVCSYDACYYCYECHMDDEAIIPSRIIHNWDFSKHKVAKLTKLFLQQIEDEPLINLKQYNPAIYNYINELNDAKTLRSQLHNLKAYLFTCKQSVAEDLRRRIWPREYMLENVHLYSIQDLKQVQSGHLTQTLKKIINFAAKHVKGCTLCSQKGFICEICDNPKIIYPFDLELTVRCERCKTVFHKTCKTETKPCPKCNRRRLREVHPGQVNETVDFASPWH
ncbi:pleckstrin homology domain-containing family M member 1-like isoform X2 [Glandiceps talaboti]